MEIHNFEQKSQQEIVRGEHRNSSKIGTGIQMLRFGKSMNFNV